MHTDIAEKQRRAALQAWYRACRWEDIDIHSKFVIFSPENPHAKTYNTLMSGYLHLDEIIESACLDDELWEGDER